MERRPGPVGLLACAAVVLPACLPAISQAAEVWAVRGGTTTISLDSGAIERLGLKAEGPAPEICPSTDRQCRLVFPVRGRSTLTFVLADGGRPEFLDGRILHFGGLSVATPEQEQSLCDFVITPLDGRSFDRLQAVEAVGDRPGGVVLDRIKLGFDRGSRTLTIHSGSLHVSPVWAEALGDPSLAEHSLGTVTVEGVSEWVEGTGPEAETEAASDGQPRDVGCDMTFCQLYDLEQFGREGDIVGLAIATTSWNLGDADCLWFPIPSEDHPFIIMNLYREKDDRFEQIGQSWVKHGFYALGNTQCGGTCTFEEGHSAGSWLGVGCTDTYSSALNAAQNGLGPRYEINPWTGAWTYEGSHLSQGSHYHDGIEHRLQVYDDDLDPALNPEATYYGEGFYAMLDDADAMNSASWKPAPASGSPGGTWTASPSTPGPGPSRR